jgi:phage tail tape-measure protein
VGEVGATLGDGVGATVGELEGAAVGASEGAAVGDAVGETLGAVVGEMVGARVGAAVGATVAHIFVFRLSSSSMPLAPSPDALVSTADGRGWHNPLVQSPPTRQF